MQNYGQAPGYQRPGSTSSFGGQQSVPAAYPGTQGYQTNPPAANSQWAPPPQNAATGAGQWNQSAQQTWGQPGQQQQGGYNPSTYGAMPGGQQQQQQDHPPPPPPKPQGFAAAVQQQQTSQSYAQPPGYPAQTAQQNTGYTPQTQQTDFSQQGQSGGFQQQAGYQNPQQQYNAAAPPPPSGTPGGSYFPPAQQGRPTSVYGTDQINTYATPQSATTQQPPPNVLSPNEQQPAYIPPSLTGQGVQSYMPVNTNPAPGVYIPPPPDIPAWQQAAHAPLQGGVKKFKYTKPMVDPSFQAQGYQPLAPMQQPMQQQGQFGQPGVQPQQQYGQPVQDQFQSQGQMQQPGQYGQQTVQPQPQPQQFVPPVQQQGQFTQAQQFTQIPQGGMQQPAQQYPPQQNQYQPSPPTDQGFVQQQQNQYQPTPPTDQGFVQQQQNQYQPTPPTDQGYVQQQQTVPDPYGAQQPMQQQGWQAGHQSQGSFPGQQQPQGQDHGIQAPKPLTRTGTTPNFVSEPSPHSQPVSPVQNRQSMSFGAGQTSHLGRTGSVSSIALGALRNQQAGVRTASPAPAKVPSPPLPEEKTKFSALGMGGPSDWEHFGMGDDEIDDEDLFAKKDEPAQLDSVELPAHVPSPPSTVGEWPTPPPQPAPLNVGIQRRETFQPTPPPPRSSGTPAQLPSQPPQQGFVMGDAMVVSHSPQPGQTHPPLAQQGFVMGDAGWAPPKQGTPLQQQQQPPPPAPENNFVMGDGGWAAHSAPSQPRQQTPSQQAHQPPPPVNSSFAMGGGSWGAGQQTPTQASGGWGAQAQGPNPNHIAELKAKDDELKAKDDKLKAKDNAYERLKTDSEKEKGDLRAEFDRLRADIDNGKAHTAAEIARLTADIENTKTHASAEKTVLAEQLEAIKAASEQAKLNADALIKEKDSMIERLKEDIEGKDEVIAERDGTIAERDGIIADLKRQLDAERQKELPKPKPADLVPDIDIWYAGSLERYIGMLRIEASEPQVEDKINAFTNFLRAESGIRGLPYYDAPPPAPVVPEPVIAPHHEEPAVLARKMSNASLKKMQNIHVQVPEPQTPDGPDISPGGRPIFRRKPTLKSNESVPTEHSFSMSSEPEQFPSFNNNNNNNPILTPTSSQDDDFNKTPIQSPPEEPAPASYKAYVPPGVVQSESSHRLSMSIGAKTVLPSATPKNTDEIFFGEPAATPPSAASRPATGGTGSLGDVPVPRPLSFTPAPASQPRPLSFTPAPSAVKKAPLDVLADLLPKSPPHPGPDDRIVDIRKKAQELPSDFSFIADITSKFDKSAAQVRAKNDRERRKRQEESEEKTDQLFNDNEISYADIGDIEDEFKEKERASKAQEDRDEYKTYVEEVFDKVYDGLQEDVKTLMGLCMDTEALLHDPMSGLDSTKHIPATDCLSLLQELHGLAETRHDLIVRAVAERDKRYKKTEIQPLYAAGNIAKMKSMEKHFEAAEKQAVLRTHHERAERVGELVRVAEEAVVAAVGKEQGEFDRLLSALKNISPDDNSDAKPDLLAATHERLHDLKTSAKDILTLFNALEIALNTTVLEAEIMQAKMENAAPAKLQQLEAEMKDGEANLKQEFERKCAIIEKDREEVDRLVAEKGVPVKVELSEEQEKERRMKAALEEAKRRNGAV
ncbi:hypothetical protein P154DRAFT_520041 [Amniculicola lignicola CBS 123094]|uniref:Uncharacterized protein n=1 Tax=Amniculicola lignicola CBS 123094 TaxID=1392246 RepID=A0A6A5WNY4_9PLEO|nr:hypothetical protein P154DRAFT_520041 [Amniculicola lignicola CBS 123094]